MLQPIFDPKSNGSKVISRLSTDPPPNPSSPFSKPKLYVENGNINASANTKDDAPDTTLADYVENFARILFLVVYLVFNCIYWVKYRNYSHDPVNE